MKKRDYKTGIEISDADWQRFEKFLPQPEASLSGGQKYAPNRACLEGLLWLLRSGARYKDMPKHFPSGSTCWFRLQFWTQQGALRKLHQQLLRLLDKKGKLNLKECFGDGTFSAAKKGGTKLVRPKKAKGQR